MTILVNRKAPEFTAPAVLASGEIIDQLNFSKQRNGKYAVIVFYPLDFTFVCPTEILAFNDRVEEFRALGAEVGVGSG